MEIRPTTRCILRSIQADQPFCPLSFPSNPMTWPYAFTPYMLPMLASAACLAALAGYAWHRRSVPGARPLALMMLFALLWAIGAAFEVAATMSRPENSGSNFRRSGNCPW